MNIDPHSFKDCVIAQLFQKQVSYQRVSRVNGIGSEISNAGFPQNILINTKAAREERSVFKEYRMSGIRYDLRFSASQRIDSRQQR
jgi:hypothetical protein